MTAVWAHEFKFMYLLPPRTVLYTDGEHEFSGQHPGCESLYYYLLSICSFVTRDDDTVDVGI